MEKASDPSSSEMAQQDNNQKNLEKIKQCHDEAYLYIEQGLNLDEMGHKDQATVLYSKGLDCMNLAFSIPHEGPQCTGQEWQKAKNLIRKMQGTRRQIQMRLDALMESSSKAAENGDRSPPSYEEAVASRTASIDMALDEILHDDKSDASDASMAAATELFRIDEGVQIFFIRKDGYVSAPSYPSSLGVYKFVDSVLPSSSQTPDVELSQAFLKVGSWTYPLLEGQSPVLHATWGAYIFPDVMSLEGDAVGVIIPDYVSPPERIKFEQIMNKYTSVRDQELPPSEEEQKLTPTKPVLPPGEPPKEVQPLADQTTTSKISRGIETAAEWISWGIIKGAQKTGKLVQKGSTKLQQNIKPENQSVSVDPKTQKGLYYTRKATEGVVMVSSFIVNKLGQGTMYLAHKAAPHIREQGEKYLPQCIVKKEASGQSKLDGALEIAAGGIKGWITVYTGLEQAAKTLAKSIADETVHVVTHKYGEDVGRVTEDTLYAGGNIAMAIHYTSGIGTKAIAKRVAKDTGKALAEESVAKKQVKSDTEDVEVGPMDCGDKSTELRDK